MLKIVDSNYLRAPDLRQFLTASSRNHAVLTDYAAMEAYKASSLVALYESMSILAERPRQVIVLRGTAWACGMRGRRAGLQRRLIDHEQTAGFADWCGMIKSAQAGDTRMQAHLLELADTARDQMDAIQRDARTMLDALGDVQSDFTSDELNLIRTSKPLTDKIMSKIQNHVALTAQQMFAKHPNVMKLPRNEEYPNTFIFRMAFCVVLWALMWITEGSQKNIRLERIRNDMIDMNFAVFGTYFDGLLTNDQRLAELYRGLSYVLYRVFPETKPSSR